MTEEAEKKVLPEGWDGMLPAGTTCLNCGKVLNADGGHPAELYLGTYNGLCYPCTSAPAFLVQECEDGSQEWSHPPHCPSWRRNREIRYGYEGCETCGGKGSVRQFRPDSQGGSYTYQCPVCRTRKWPPPPLSIHNAPGGRAQREAAIYELEMGFPPRNFEKGTVAYQQWTYTGKGFGRGEEKLRNLLALTKEVSR